MRVFRVRAVFVTTTGNAASATHVHSYTYQLSSLAMSSVAKGAKRKKQKTSDEVLTARTTTTKSTTRHDEDTDAERLRKLAHEIAERGTELASIMGKRQHAEGIYISIYRYI